MTKLARSIVCALLRLGSGCHVYGVYDTHILRLVYVCVLYIVVYIFYAFFFSPSLTDLRGEFILSLNMALIGSLISSSC